MKAVESKVQSPKSKVRRSKHRQRSKYKAQRSKLQRRSARSYSHHPISLRNNSSIASTITWSGPTPPCCPGADAAVVRIKETRRALAMSLDGNGRYCAANPREGAKLIVAEAARNVVCVGARPLAITNCLNFASPERPEVMWSFSEVIDGMAEACRSIQHAGRFRQCLFLQRD